MTTERMLELLLIGKLLENMTHQEILDEGYSAQALEDRATELVEEFLEPYVIDNAEKSE